MNVVIEHPYCQVIKAQAICYDEENLRSSEPLVTNIPHSVYNSCRHINLNIVALLFGHFLANPAQLHSKHA